MNTEQGNTDKIEAALTLPYDPTSPLPDNLLAMRKEYEELSEQDRTKHIYAVAGLALYAAQCFEREMLHLLLVQNRTTGRIRSPEEYDMLEGRLTRKTLGNLMKRVNEVVEVNEHGKSLLTDALRARNALAHGFFWTHAENFMTTTGQRKMMDELLGHVHLFKTADHFCGIIGNVLMDSLGVSQETIDKSYQELLQELKRRESQ